MLYNATFSVRRLVEHSDEMFYIGKATLTFRSPYFFSSLVRVDHFRGPSLIGTRRPTNRLRKPNLSAMVPLSDAATVHITA